MACVQIEKLLTTEAARIAQALGINRAIYEDTNTDECRRTFWVIYILEKTQCFACGRDSVFAFKRLIKEKEATDKNGRY